MHFTYSHACYIPSQPQTIMNDNIELTEKLQKETDLCFMVTLKQILKVNSVRRASTCLSLVNSLFSWKSMKSAKKTGAHQGVCDFTDVGYEALHAPPISFSSNFITRTILGEEYRTLSSSLCSFLHSPVISSLPGPNTLLNTLFSNTLSLCSSLNISDQVSHPYKTTGKIIILYNLIFKFSIANWKTKDSAPNDRKHSLTLICS